MYKNQKILVTGGTGFLGRAIAAHLRLQGAVVCSVGSKDADLRDRQQSIDLLQHHSPQLVIHCAVQGGGIGWMKQHPVDSGLDNFRINANVMEASFLAGAESFVGVSSACAYPRICPIPFREEDLWNGFPEPTNAGYALSKRMMMELGRGYNQQHGFHTVFPVLANLYGPGDHLDTERAHVVADLMIRCAQQPEELILWGSGKPTREFLYIDDAVTGVLACQQAKPASVINIGTGIETSIVELAKAVLAVHKLDIPIRLDSQRPDGQPRKVLCVQRAQQELGWRARVSLKDGLQRTASWYLEHFG